ncbi:MAG TPA: hypothetical protein V6D03_06935 [Candidatus Caenarcaniphilales bacterium]
MHSSTVWYIVKHPNGSCQILPNLPEAEESQVGQKPPTPQHWGPFNSQEEAIARRVGLIRAGKCQPAQPAS